jgi:hypothetical protein
MLARKNLMLGLMMLMLAMPGAALAAEEGGAAKEKDGEDKA